LYSYANISAHIKHDAVSGIAVVSDYQWPFEQWIPQVKFHNHINSAKIMGQMLNEHLKHTLWLNIDLICPMPIHSKRLRERGYNQADLICEFIDYATDPKLCRALTRVRYTQAQTELNKKERQNNMKQAFACNNTVKGKTVLLVDDVITTGHTANAAAQALLDAGATTVYLAAVAIRKYT
jgi:ComF family protein